MESHATKALATPFLRLRVVMKMLQFPCVKPHLCIPYAGPWMQLL